jgi:hypothetical protein
LKKAILFLFLLTALSFAGPVSHFGALKVCKVNNKGQLCGEKVPGTAVFVKGPSLYWSVPPGTAFYNKETVEWFTTQMQIGVIRAAMAIRYWDNGNNGTNSTTGMSTAYYNSPDTQKSLMKMMIEAAIENDIYIIIDWHSHVAHNETALATTFFREMATEYKDVPNLIWEVYNEPLGGTSTGTVTTHSNSIINAIRNAGNNNLILVGSPSWSQQPYEQAQNMFGNDNSTGSNNAMSKNVAFSFHFYAAEHHQTSGVGQSASNALSAGYAVFGSEWGGMNANGKGNISTSETSKWTTWMDNNKVSSCTWSASNANETASLFSSTATSTDLSISHLTEHGRLFNTYMSANKWTALIPESHPKGNDLLKSVADGQSITLSSADLGLDGNITAVSQPEFGSVSNTGSSITFSTPQKYSPDFETRFTYKITKNNITIQRIIVIKVTNRRPVVPERGPITVSRKTPTPLTIMGNLSASDPNNTGVSYKEATLSNPGVGTLVVKKDTIVFTPNPSLANVAFTEVTINYTVESGGGLSTYATDVLHIKNIPPTVNPFNGVYCCFSGGRPNTEQVGIGMEQVRGVDKDGDPLQFVKLYLDPWYPGTLTQVKPDSFVYTPDPNKTGKVVFLIVLTDGTDESAVGKSYLTLNGNGQAIGNHPDGANGPTEIPGFAPIISQPNSGVQGLNVRALGSGKVVISFAQSGLAKLDVYSLSGKNMGTLLNGHQNAGSSEVSLSNLKLQKGIYILRLSQGSQVKTLRIMN